MVEEIEWNTTTGWPSEVLDDILEGIREKHEPGFWKDLGKVIRGEMTVNWKAGQSVDPEDRASRPDYREYYYMEVVYETSSKDHADQMENGITAEYIDKDANDNERQGGAGRLPQGNRIHYVYIVYNY